MKASQAYLTFETTYCYFSCKLKSKLISSNFLLRSLNWWAWRVRSLEGELSDDPVSVRQTDRPEEVLRLLQDHDPVVLAVIKFFPQNINGEKSQVDVLEVELGSLWESEGLLTVELVEDTLIFKSTLEELLQHVDLVHCPVTINVLAAYEVSESLDAPVCPRLFLLLVQNFSLNRSFPSSLFFFPQPDCFKLLGCHLRRFIRFFFSIIR